MVISQCYGVVGMFEYLPTDIHLSYLPIAHAFERYITWAVAFFGGNIRYAKYPIT